MEKNRLSGQIVPLRPFIHKVYLLVDLLLPSFSALLVAATIAVGQTPGHVALTRWPEFGSMIVIFESGPAMPPGAFLEVVHRPRFANGDIYPDVDAGLSFVVALTPFRNAGYLGKRFSANRRAGCLLFSAQPAAVKTGVKMSPNFADTG